MAESGSATEYQNERIAALEAQLKAVHGELETTRAELETTQGELEATRAVLETMRTDLRKTRTEKEALRHECEMHMAANRDLCGKLRSAGQQADYSERVIRNLSDQVHRLESTVEAFRSGSKFNKLRSMYESDAAGLHRQIRQLRSELNGAERALREMRVNWTGVLEDYERQIERERKDHTMEIRRHEDRYRKAQKREERTRERLRKKESDCKRLKAQLEESQEREAKLERQVNMNYENSSLTSASCEIKRKKIPNSREKSGLRPGAQPGHKGYCRRRLEPTETVVLEAPDNIANSWEWMQTGRKKCHQVIGLEIRAVVTDYVSMEYENIHTGKLYSPSFPDVAVNDVNYDASIMAALLYLTHQCNVSIEKARQFVRDVSRGVLSVSHGFIEDLPQKFSRRTASQRDEIYRALEQASSLHADFTVGWVDGARVAVGVCSDGKNHVLYRMSPHKGHEAAKLLPVKDVMVLISDREPTLLNGYGVHHQVCLEHLRRDLKDVIQNDPDRKWAVMMKDLIHELRGKAKTWGGKGLPKEERRAYEKKYDEIISLGEQEYEKKPARKALPQGPNLLDAMKRLKKCVLYFLRHPWIPPDNSEAERRVRLFKRKQHQCVTFRSDLGITAACDFLTVITTARLQNKDVFVELENILTGPPPPSVPQTAV